MAPEGVLALGEASGMSTSVYEHLYGGVWHVFQTLDTCLGTSDNICIGGI